MRAVKAWSRFLVHDGVLAESPLAKLRYLCEPATSRTPVAELDGIERLLATCSGDSLKDAVRIMAIISLLRATGIRRGELIAMEWLDIDFGENTITLRTDTVRYTTLLAVRTSGGASRRLMPSRSNSRRWRGHSSIEQRRGCCRWTASATTPPPSCSSLAATTPTGSAPRPPSLTCAVSHHSRRHRARPSGTSRSDVVVMVMSVVTSSRSRLIAPGEREARIVRVMSFPVHRISRAGSSALFTLLLVGGSACSSSSDEDSDNAPADTVAEADPVAGPAASALLAPAEFADYLDQNPDAPVVNVHVPYEGHIEDTDAFVDFETIATWTDLPDDLDAPLVLYCMSGNMSAQATADLAGLGYTNIVDLEGGMQAWSAAGFELLDDPAAETD